jgi:murein DD-endopeptidase MepM/ murein hydrolase activator NlpD
MADFHSKKSIEYLLGRVKLHDCFGWAQPVIAPFAGTVVHAADEWPERQTVHLVRDVFIALKNGLFYNEKRHADLRQVAGNYLILEGANCFAFLAHLKNRSITVKKGDSVVAGQLLGEVGHSGNSTAPHLHFHLMDGPDPRSASGLPCSFDNYEVYRDDTWMPVRHGIPGRL